MSGDGSDGETAERVSRSKNGWLSTGVSSPVTRSSLGDRVGRVDDGGGRQPGQVAVPVGADPRTGTVRGELERLDAQRVVGAVERDDRAQCPRPGLPPRQLDGTVKRPGMGVQLPVRRAQPPGDLAGVLGQHREVTGGDVEPEEVELRELPAVQTQDRLARPPDLRFEAYDLGTGEGGEIDRLGIRVLQVDPVEVPVLISVAVLFVEQPPRIVGPVVGMPAAVVVGGDTARLLIRIDALHPDVQSFPPLRRVGDPGAVGRDRGPGTDGRAEEVLASEVRHLVRNGGHADTPSGFSSAQLSSAQFGAVRFSAVPFRRWGRRRLHRWLCGSRGRCAGRRPSCR